MEAKIAGGFLEIPTNRLVWAWSRCRSGEAGLGMGDFRTWLAAHEMVARRLSARSRTPKFSIRELSRLTDVRERSTRASVRRLASVGLLVFGQSEIGFPGPPDTFALGCPIADTIARGEGSAKIPRRLLRFLVAGARPALIATALGTLLRCLSRRRSGWNGRGRAKASWIAEVFGLTERAVQSARLELCRLGWIEGEATNQRAENRWGRVFRISLTWGAPGRKRSYPRPSMEPHSFVSSVDQEPLPEREENPEPPQRVQTGACAGKGCPDPETSPVALEAQPTLVEAIPVPPPAPVRVAAPVQAVPVRVAAPLVASAAKLQPPKLSDLRPEDITDIDRLAAIQAQAAQAGLVGTSEADRLKVVALAEHCQRIGKNPPALFSALLRRGAWSFITQAEEDVARKRLKAHFQPRPTIAHGRPLPQPSFPPVPLGPAERRSTFVSTAQPSGPTSLASILGRLGEFGFGG